MWLLLENSSLVRSSGAECAVFLSGPAHFVPLVSPWQVFSCQERERPEGKQKRLSLHLLLPLYPSQEWKYKIIPLTLRPAPFLIKPSLLNCISLLHPYQASCTLHLVVKVFITQLTSSLQRSDSCLVHLTFHTSSSGKRGMDLLPSSPRA